MPTFLLSLLSLLSAFLLFQVQPVISKFILPWFGGSPGVWTTCMLFFQVVLFLGYAYAHGLMKLPHRLQAIIHGALVLAALALLHIAPSADWKPTGSEDPVGRILLLLLANVALPYFVLSSTSPLVQVWFSRAQPMGSPWRLYALSNIGSLVALLTYPFVIEPRLDVLEQTRWWQWLFIGFCILSLALAVRDRRAPLVASTQSDEELAAERPRIWQRVLWVLLPAFASAMLLATTNHVCQDVAVIPFLWIAPLSLYLITFIICFEHERWYRPLLWASLAVPFILIAAGYSQITENIDEWPIIKAVVSMFHLNPNVSDIVKSFKTQLIVCFGTVFLACMIFHGELTRLKPSHRHLTEFYLMMSAGGALGGLGVSLIAPRVFTTYLEWPIGLMGCFAVACIALARAARSLQHSSEKIIFLFVLTAVGVALVFIVGDHVQPFASRHLWPLIVWLLWIGVGCSLTFALVVIVALAREEFQRTAMIVAMAILAASGFVLIGEHLLRIVAFDSQILGRPVRFLVGLFGSQPTWISHSAIWLLRGIVFVPITWLLSTRSFNVTRTTSIISVCGVTLWSMGVWGCTLEPREERVRNFYGAVSVEKIWDEEQGSDFVQLHHGGIVHGTQWLSDDWRQTPLSYYSHASGIGRALDTLEKRPDARVGIVGMGSATSAAYAKKGHTFRFYDINPDIVRIAKTHFTYLKDLETRGAKLEIAMGDARLNLEREESQQFDVLLLDAFAGDSVPVHLLTKEAFEIYRRHMKPDGIIAVHVTNRYLTLAPVIKKVAAATGYQWTRIITDAESPYEYTDYVLVTNNEAFLKANEEDTKGYDESEKKLDPPLWTDLRHDLWGVLEKD